MAAAPSASVTVKGLDRLLSTLRQAEADISDMVTAVDKTGALVAAEARRRAPVRSGRLAGSIFDSKERNLSAVGSDVIYAPPIHWGWKARGISPNRFLYDAAQDTETIWLRFWETDIGRALAGVKGA
jgi:hypothetical protein